MGERHQKLTLEVLFKNIHKKENSNKWLKWDFILLMDYSNCLSNINDYKWSCAILCNKFYFRQMHEKRMILLAKTILTKFQCSCGNLTIRHTCFWNNISSKCNLVHDMKTGNPVSRWRTAHLNVWENLPSSLDLRSQMLFNINLVSTI